MFFTLQCREIALYSFQNNVEENFMSRNVHALKDDWKFCKVQDAVYAGAMGYPQGADLPQFDDSHWQTISIPHDYSIHAPLDWMWRDHCGFFPGGIGYYRKQMHLTDVRHKNYYLQMDGAYRNSTIWVNGKFVETRNSGYISYCLNISEFVKEGDNLLTIRTHNADTPNCRWYTGSGLYRNVYLIETGNTHILPNSVVISTPDVHSQRANISIRAKFQASDMDLSIQVCILDGDGKTAAETTQALISKVGQGDFDIQLNMISPLLWSLDAPSLYTAKIKIIQNDKVLDEISQTFGIRKIEYMSGKGFFLNGVETKMKGVCLHHDGGPVGAAVPTAVWHYRLQQLKNIGCNAIRTSHNPPSPEFLDLCDALGFLVMDEFCDKWEPPHYLNFETDYPRDLSEFIMRDINHPCVVIWSVGNENDEPESPYLLDRTRILCDLTRQIDSTRPVIVALERGRDGDFDHAKALMVSACHCDFLGVNYAEHWYKDILLKYPDALILGTENYVYYRSSFAVRDNKIEAHPYLAVLSDPRVMGEFIWTGMDYLGEAKEGLPNIGLPVGIVDITGYPKPIAKLYQALWSEKPYVGTVVYRQNPYDHSQNGLWFWPQVDAIWQSQEKEVFIATYTNCHSVELFCNGKSMGEKSLSDFENRIMIWQVPFEAGELVSVGKINGVEACREILRTPQAPQKLKLRLLNEDAWELRQGVIVEIVLVDQADTICPVADQSVFLSVQNAAILGLANGDLTWHGPFNGNEVPLLNGRAIAILRVNGNGAYIEAKCGEIQSTLELV